MFDTRFEHDDIALIMHALAFAADKHRDQRRKDQAASPYINHPIAVAHMLWHQGRISDVSTLIGALLHDTLEDTDTTHAELCQHFGHAIADLVAEVSDDKNLPKAERKRLQIEHAAHISRAAQHIKLADKICNVRDVTTAPPHDWDTARRRAYLDWTAQVIAGLRGCCLPLETYYDEALALGYAAL